MGISRRLTRLTAAMAAASVLALSACGGSAELAAGGAEPDSVGGTRVVVDVEGTEVEVPEAPRRVVTLSEPTLDGVLALGLEPIGTVTGRGQATVPAYLQDVAGDLPVLGSVAQPNFEAIGAAGPDLILVDGTSVNNNPDVIAALREIAPVVYTGYAGGDWRLNFGLTAEALGKEDQAEEIIADYDERAAAIAAELEPEYGDKTFSIVRWQGGGAATILQELPPGAALEDLGLARPPSQDMRGRGHSNPVSLENLEEIDADYMFFGTLGGSSVDNPQAGGSADVEEAESALQTAVETPGFSQLKAYQEGNIIPVDGSAWTSTGGPLLMTRIIEDVREELLR